MVPEGTPQPANIAVNLDNEMALVGSEPVPDNGEMAVSDTNTDLLVSYVRSGEPALPPEMPEGPSLSRTPQTESIPPESIPPSLNGSPVTEEQARQRAQLITKFPKLENLLEHNSTGTLNTSTHSVPVINAGNAMDKRLTTQPTAVPLVTTPQIPSTESTMYMHTDVMMGNQLTRAVSNNSSPQHDTPERKVSPVKIVQQPHASRVQSQEQSPVQQSQTLEPTKLDIQRNTGFQSAQLTPALGSGDAIPTPTAEATTTNLLAQLTQLPSKNDANVDSYIVSFAVSNLTARVEPSPTVEASAEPNKSPMSLLQPTPPPSAPSASATATFTVLTYAQRTSDSPTGNYVSSTRMLPTDQPEISRDPDHANRVVSVKITEHGDYVEPPPVVIAAGNQTEAHVPLLQVTQVPIITPTAAEGEASPLPYSERPARLHTAAETPLESTTPTPAGAELAVNTSSTLPHVLHISDVTPLAPPTLTFTPTEPPVDTSRSTQATVTTQFSDSVRSTPTPQLTRPGVAVTEPVAMPAETTVTNPGDGIDRTSTQKSLPVTRGSDIGSTTRQREVATGESLQLSHLKPENYELLKSIRTVLPVDTPAVAMPNTNTTTVLDQALDAGPENVTEAKVEAAEAETEAEAEAEAKEEEKKAEEEDWKPGNGRRKLFKSLKPLQKAVADFIAPYLPTRGNLRRRLSDSPHLGKDLMEKIRKLKSDNSVDADNDTADMFVPGAESNDTEPLSSLPDEVVQSDQVMGTLDLTRPFPQQVAPIKTSNAAETVPATSDRSQHAGINGLPHLANSGGLPAGGLPFANQVAQHLTQLLLHPAVQQALRQATQQQPSRAEGHSHIQRDMAMPEMYQTLLDSGRLTGSPQQQPSSAAGHSHAQQGMDMSDAYRTLLNKGRVTGSPSHPRPVSGMLNSPYTFFPDSKRFRQYPQNVKRRRAQSLRLAVQQMLLPPPGSVPTSEQGRFQSSPMSSPDRAAADRTTYHDLRHGVFDIHGRKAFNYQTRFTDHPVVNRVYRRGSTRAVIHRLTDFDRTPQMSDRVGKMLLNRFGDRPIPVPDTMLHQRLRMPGAAQVQHRTVHAANGHLQPHALLPRVATAQQSSDVAARRAQDALDTLQVDNGEVMVQDALDSAVPDVPVPLLT